MALNRVRGNAMEDIWPRHLAIHTRRILGDVIFARSLFKASSSNVPTLPPFVVVFVDTFYSTLDTAYYSIVTLSAEVPQNEVTVAAVRNLLNTLDSVDPQFSLTGPYILCNAWALLSLRHPDLYDTIESAPKGVLLLQRIPPLDAHVIALAKYIR